MPADFPDKLYITTDTITFYLVNNWESLIFLSLIAFVIVSGIFLASVFEDFNNSKIIATISAVLAILIISTLIIVPPREILIGRLINKIMIINNIPTQHYHIVRGVLEEQGILNTKKEVVKYVAKFRLYNIGKPVHLIELEDGIVYESIDKKLPTN